MAANQMETRFAHLLKPIRDLTKNWDVDIASYLEEYLDEIDKITITFDGGQTSMNFAEAALLIQASACVYSKKVEYLYSLVYQVLDLLASKKKLNQAAATDEEGNQTEEGNNRNRDQDEEFLTLDDIREHKNLDMKNDGDEFNMTIVSTIPRTPMALVAIDDAEKGENPLISLTGEVLGNRKDFKMNTCNVHQSGVMLLDMSHLSLLEISMLHKPSSTPFPFPRTVARINGENTNVVATDELPVDEGLQDMSMDDGGPIDMPDDLGNSNDPLGLDAPDQDAAADIELRRSERRKENLVPAPQPHKPLIDPWLQHDPHEAERLPNKPVRRAKTFKIPAILETETTKKRKRKQTTEIKKLTPIAEFCTAAYHSKANKFSNNPLKVPAFPELEHLYWMEFRRRQAKQRKDRKTLITRGQLVELAEEEELQQQEEANDDNYHDNMGAGLEDDEVIDDLPLDIPDVQELLCGHQFDQGLRPLHNTEPAEAPTFVSCYEDLVRHHVECYLASAQQYAQITELSKRVSEWEDKILPTLREEETHEPFDIHIYGTRVINKLKPEDGNSENHNAEQRTYRFVPFREVVKSKPAFEVCRLFLAALQLANNYNVEVGCDGKTVDESIDTMKLKFLTDRRHFEELEEYRAPSLETH